MERLQNTINWTIIFSETSHIFCCVLPTLFSVMSLLAGVGLVSAMPPAFVTIHEALHAWEIPLIALSAAVILLGWALYAISRRMDCRGTGCVHEPCEPRKKQAHVVLLIATVLFVFNVGVFTLFHLNADSAAQHVEHAE